MNKESNNFSGKLGFVLASAGSAVGLGNLWRFPYLAAKYGGGIFLLIYLIIAVTFGFVLMVTEIAIGRKTGTSVVDAFKKLDKRFSFVGYLAALVPAIIYPYYCVIGGWVVKYFLVFLSNDVKSAVPDDYFEGFISQSLEPAGLLVVFAAIVCIIVMLGVQKGIEKVSKILMPVLVVLSVGIAAYGMTVDGAMEGVIYYIKPDFDKFSVETILAALGQLFYSMSLAMGIMITYGSYMKKKDHLESSVRYIEIFDTAIAFISGLIIVPAVFAFSGGSEESLKSGPSLMFVTLPKVFDSMKFGNIIGFVFFVLVFLAALTSAISLMETLVSVLMAKTKFRRKPVCLMILAFTLIIGIPVSLGFGVLDFIAPLGMSILDFLDFISNSILMPITALLTCIFVGFIIKPKSIIDEVEQDGAPFKEKRFYSFFVKYIAPIMIIAILMTSILSAFGVITL